MTNKEKKKAIDYFNAIDYKKVVELENYLNSVLSYKISSLSCYDIISVEKCIGLNNCGMSEQFTQINEIEKKSEIHIIKNYKLCLSAFINKGQREILRDEVYIYILIFINKN